MTEKESCDAIETTQLSVIIPTCERPDMLKRLLDVLIPDAAGHLGVELIVVDDTGGANAGKLEGLLAKWSRAPLILHKRPVRGGPSAARNTGITLAKGKILAFLDDDILPQPGFIEQILRLHAAYPEALLISGNLHADRNDLYSRFWFHYYNAAFNRPGKGELYPIARVASSNFSIKRVLLERFSPLFDESLHSREDYDLSLRLSQAGVILWKGDSINAIQFCRRTLREFLNQRAWYREGEVRVRNKWGAAYIKTERAQHRAPTPWHLWYLHLVLYVATFLSLCRRLAK